MDNQKAKFILQSCRPTGADAGDPHFAEALASARRTPELAEWFAREQALDAALALKLKQVEPPAGLRERLRVEPEEEEVPPPFTSRRTLALLALAACAALLATVALVFWQRPHAALNLAAFRQEMLTNLSGPLHLSHQSADIQELTQWLSEQRNVSGVVIPRPLQNLSGIGCRTWMWNGKPVGLICFRLEGDRPVHFLVVDRAAVPTVPPDLRATFSKEAGWTTAVWADADKLYVLAGHDDEEVLAKLL